MTRCSTVLACQGRLEAALRSCVFDLIHLSRADVDAPRLDFLVVGQLDRSPERSSINVYVVGLQTPKVCRTQRCRKSMGRRSPTSLTANISRPAGREKATSSRARLVAAYDAIIVDVEC